MMSADVCTERLEGWKEIAAFLGLRGKPEATRARLRDWEQFAGLPVYRIRGRVFADPRRLRTWFDAGGPETSQRVA